MSHWRRSHEPAPEHSYLADWVIAAIVVLALVLDRAWCTLIFEGGGKSAGEAVEPTDQHGLLRIGRAEPY